MVSCVMILASPSTRSGEWFRNVSSATAYVEGRSTGTELSGKSQYMEAQFAIWGWAPIEDRFPGEVKKMNAFLAVVLRWVEGDESPVRVEVRRGSPHSTGPCYART